MADTRVDRGGLDRMALMQPQETKNLRFDFKTDDLQFHSSEEEYDEEELELEEEEMLEEEEEEEEEYYEEEEEEEEFDSEAEDPEEEAMLKARGVIDDYGDDHGIVINDASDLLPPAPSTKPNPLPVGADPWAADPSASSLARDAGNIRDPLKEFRKQKEDQRIQPTPVSAPTKQTTSQTRPGTAVKPAAPLSQPAGPKAPASSPQAPVMEVKNKQPVSQMKPTVQPKAAEEKKPDIKGTTAVPAVKANQPVVKSTTQAKPPEPVKRVESHPPPEDRKLELEGAPKQRKTNPLDRVVAKLSGRTEPKEAPQTVAAEKPATKPAEPTKNVTVNLNKLMEKAEESEEDESQTPVKVDYAEIQKKIQEEAAKYREAEEQKIRRQQEADLKAFREKLSKECRDAEEKIRKENASSIQKFRDEEKKKMESAKRQFESQLQLEHKKKVDEMKALLEKENTGERKKLREDMKKANEEEAERIKLEYVQEMQKKKELMQKEHSEEMQDLEQELNALYAEQKTSVEAEIKTAKATAAVRNSKEAAAVADLERSLTELLRERQVEVTRGHHKQLTVLQDELEKELENAARQAKEKETAEKKTHAARLSALKNEHEAEISQCEEEHEQDMKDLEAQHKDDLAKLKAEFKSELTLQKTELENKLTEFRIEYEQRMDSIGQGEEDPEEMEDGRDDGDESAREETSQISGVRDSRFGSPANARVGMAVRVKDEEKKYDQILKELRDRRKSLEEDLEELKTQESKVKEMKKQKHISEPASCCDNGSCVHESKYKKMKAKYSSLVNRIKSEKAKKTKRLVAAQEVSSMDTHSLSGDKVSTESNLNMSEGGQHSDVMSSIMSSPKPSPHHLKSTSEVSEDEDVQLAMQVMEKYSKRSDYKHISHLSSVNGSLKQNMTKPLVSTPKKAWLEDDLLVHGRKVLDKTEKFLKASHIREQKGLRDLEADEIHKEILRQNAAFERQPSRKVPARRLSLAHGGSLTSDTESDEPTQEAPSGSSDFGLDQILAKISSENKSSPVRQRRRPLTSHERTRPLRATASLERGLNNISHPLNTYSSGYNTVSPSAPLRIDHLNAGSVPDLGPETVDRIAGVNQYLQQRWTNYFGELSVPLGGKVGWPSQVIGQSTLFVNKNSSSKFISNRDVPSSTAGKNISQFLSSSGVTTVMHEQDINISQKIDDLRAWLDSAQTTSAVLNNASK